MGAKRKNGDGRGRSVPDREEAVATVSPSFFKRHRTLVALGLLVVFSLLIHHTILFNGFANFDDSGVVVGRIAGMSSLGEELRGMARGVSLIGMPVRTLAFALIAFSLGKEPIWFHGTSLLFHTAAGLVLFFLISRILRHLGLFTREENRGRDVAFLTSLLFLIHPINSNAVAWATCLKENLCAFFSFLSFLYYIKAEERSGRWVLHYTASALFVLLALGSKPTAVVLPAIFLVFSFLSLEGRGFWERIREIRYHLLLSAAFIFLFLLFYYQWMSGFVFEIRQEITTRILSIFYSLFVYARNFLAPFWLNVRYPDEVITNLTQNIRVFAGIAGFFALLIFSILRLKKDAVPLFGLCWFLIFLAPTSGIVPISTAVADRYVYVAGVGIFLLIAYHLALVLARWVGRPAMKTAAMSAMVLLLAGLGALSLMRDRIWANDLTLWSDSIRKNPRNWIAHNNLGQYHFLRKNFSKAIEHAWMAYVSDPKQPMALQNMTRACLKNGDFEEAKVIMLELMQKIKKPSRVDYTLLGEAYRALGDRINALACFKKAIDISPNHVDSIKMLVTAYLNAGALDEAYPHLKRLLVLEPGNVEVLGKIAPVAGQLGHYEDAEAYYEQLRALRPDDMGVRLNLMALSHLQGNYARALELAEQALMALKPEEKVQYFLLIKKHQVDALISLGRCREALAGFKEARGYAIESRNMSVANGIRMSMERLAASTECAGSADMPDVFQ